MILNNFKKIVSMSLSMPFSVQRDNDLIVQKRPLFKDWSGNLISWYTGYVNENNLQHNYRFSNFFPSLLCGTITQVNETTIALPNNLATEEDLLNNKTFLYKGRIDISKNMMPINWNMAEGGAALSNSYLGLCMVVGSGDTPPTKDDYKLESWIPTTDLSIQSYSGVGPNNQEIPTFMNSITSVYKNNTNENITVKEVGLITTIGKTTEGYPTLDQIIPHPILLVRDVLESPVVIKPDEITTFTILIK